MEKTYEAIGQVIAPKKRQTAYVKGVAMARRHLSGVPGWLKMGPLAQFLFRVGCSLNDNR